jgi:hypothetical protein
LFLEVIDDEPTTDISGEVGTIHGFDEADAQARVEERGCAS